MVEACVALAWIAISAASAKGLAALARASARLHGAARATRAIDDGLANCGDPVYAAYRSSRPDAPLRLRESC